MNLIILQSMVKYSTNAKAINIRNVYVYLREIRILEAKFSELNQSKSNLLDIIVSLM